MSRRQVNFEGALCRDCGVRPVRKGAFRNGTQFYLSRCRSCDRKRSPYSPGRYRYRRNKKDHCEQCDFVPEHPCQLDVDHIDGDHTNNTPSNFQTLCANCHRLKTHLSKDWSSAA